MGSNKLMIKKISAKGFALVEIVIVTLLLGGAFIVFIEALNQTKLMQSQSVLIYNYCSLRFNPDCGERYKYQLNRTDF